MLEQAIAKASRKLIWFLILFYFFAVLDRANVSFAALSMNRTVGLTAEMFGFGATMFLIGFVILEVPSNLCLHRYGARFWLARIGVLWGVATASMVLVRTPLTFYCVRFIVGAAEAGALPGILYYMARWFPLRARAKYNSLFFLAIPLTNAVSAPIASALLGMNGVLGIAGWQWLFIVEGAATFTIGLFAWFYLPEDPASARWLSDEERLALQHELDREVQAHPKLPEAGVLTTMSNPSVIALAIAYTGINVQLNMAAFWFPQIFKSLNLTNWQVGVSTSIPFVCGSVAMILWGRRSDRQNERILHTSLPVLLAALGWALAAYATTPPMMVASLAMAATGFFSALTVFWTLPGRLLSGASAAVAIAVVSASGNLGSALAATVVGHLKDVTGGWTIPLLSIAAYALIAPAILLGQKRRLEMRGDGETFHV